MSAPLDQVAKSDVYFDGITATAWRATCSIVGPTLHIDGGAAGAHVWFFSEIFLCGPPTPDAALSLGHGNSPERLLIRNPQLAAQIAADSPQVQKALAKFQPWRWPRWLAGLGAAAATVATVLVFLRVAPALLTPLVPYSLESALGDRVQLGVRYFFNVCRNQAAEAVLEKLAARLAAGAGWQRKIDVHLVTTSVPNAFAIPGGHIYIFTGLIQSARSGDEVAGVFAHE